MESYISSLLSNYEEPHTLLSVSPPLDKEETEPSSRPPMPPSLVQESLLRRDASWLRQLRRAPNVSELSFLIYKMGI